MLCVLCQECRLKIERINHRHSLFQICRVSCQSEFVRAVKKPLTPAPKGESNRGGEARTRYAK
jgi:hypothetical protein